LLGLNFTETWRHDTYPYIDPTKADLTGKNVLITGASKGIGKATAISYAKAGASGIALAARSDLSTIVQSVKEAAQTAGRAEPNVITLNLDVTNRLSVDSAAEKLSSAFASLDVLVNNAGYLSDFASILDSDPDSWWRDWEVNVKGMYLVTRAFWPLLLQSHLKLIINMASIGATFMPPLCSSYTTTKLAVMRLTEYINQDHGAGTDGVLAIAVHPGGVMTELASNMPEDMHGLLIDTPELAADTFVWMSGERREWLGGRYVAVNWDVEELGKRIDEIVKGDLLKVRLAVNVLGTL